MQMDETVRECMERANRKYLIKRSIGKVVRHFKGDHYLIKDIAEHTEDEEELVIYVAIYGDCKVYARPFDMFIEKVPEGKLNPTNQEYRFELVNIPSIKEHCEISVEDIIKRKGE